MNTQQPEQTLDAENQLAASFGIPGIDQLNSLETLKLRDDWTGRWRRGRSKPKETIFKIMVYIRTCRYKYLGQHVKQTHKRKGNLTNEEINCNALYQTLYSQCKTLDTFATSTSPEVRNFLLAIYAKWPDALPNVSKKVVKEYMAAHHRPSEDDTTAAAGAAGGGAAAAAPPSVELICFGKGAPGHTCVPGKCRLQPAPKRKSKKRKERA